MSLVIGHGDYFRVFGFTTLDLKIRSKGGGKRGHHVADTLLLTQMFSRLPDRETFVVSDFCQKYFLSAINISPFARHGMFCVPLVCPPKKHHEQRCVLVCPHLKSVLVLRTHSYCTSETTTSYDSKFRPLRSDFS